MFNSIFRKQFVIYIGNLLVIFLILGVALNGMVRSYFYDKMQETLTTQCKRIANGYINSYVILKMPYSENASFNNEISVLYTYLNASSFVCVLDSVNQSADGDYQDVELRLLVATSNLGNVWQGDTERINKAINAEPEFKKTHYGEDVMITGTMSGAFDERMMVVGYPIIYNDFIFGVVFMNSPVAEIEANIREVVSLTLLCLALSVFIAFIMVYLSSRTISHPIHVITDVAKVIAAGNFDRRIDVRSRDEVAQLAESFNHMAESLEKQELSRRAFISNISHDLRSPLTSVKGYIQAMLDGTIPLENRDKYLNIVLDETERVTKMSNDLMFIGQFQDFDVVLSRSQFDINELVRTTLITFERRIVDKNIQIEASFADDKNLVSADYEKIQRVVYNLIDNAVKFTEPGGAISVSTSINPPKSGKIEVSIKDSGPGIPAAEQKKIFDRFYKSDQSRGMDKTGSGLGLAIVKEFVQAHGETVRVISAPEQGKGSEFIFTLPSVSV